MSYEMLNRQLGNIDIYLLDQILKGRFDNRLKILDAGCGEGRNLRYLINNGHEVYGVDTNAMAIKMLSMTYQEEKEKFGVSAVENMAFEANTFDYIISSAVLHFARDENHFMEMIQAMVTVLKPGGTLFVRMATTIGLDNPTGNTFTFLLSEEVLEKTLSRFKLGWIEPFKAVVVENKRSMAVLVLKKQMTDF